MKPSPGSTARPAVRIAASVLVNGPARITDYAEITTHDGTVRAANTRLSTSPASGRTISTLPSCMIASPIAEIVDSEDLGFFAKGEGGPAVVRMPSANSTVVINPSGGLLSKGHPTGRDRLRADLRGGDAVARRAIRTRSANARLGLTHNGGGTAAAVTVHILEAVR